MEPHIDRFFDEALSGLKQQILLMGSKVETMLSSCLSALENRDSDLAQRIIEADQEVNELEMSTDERCIQLLARYQPEASDLRFITRGLKIVTDLERVGDLAVNIAKRVIEINRFDRVPVDIQQLALLVQRMLKDSLDAFIEEDVARAEGVLKSDDQVDDLTSRNIVELLDKSSIEPQRIRLYYSTASVVRYLERIADHSTNIAELTIFKVQGRDVRHGKPH
jgi:phosphate transport system protein